MPKSVNDKQCYIAMRSSAEAMAAASSSLEYVTLRLFTDEDFQGEDAQLTMHMGMPYTAFCWQVGREDGDGKPTVIEVSLMQGTISRLHYTETPTDTDRKPPEKGDLCLLITFLSG